jgi:beta-phosphoglucomutase
LTAFSLLFDLDGTLCDTDHLHHAAFSALLQEFNRTISRDEYKSLIMGRQNEAIFRDLFPEVPETEHRTYADRKEQMFRDSLETLHPTPGLLPLLDWAEANKVGMAVVTNAPRANAERMLRGLKLEHRLPNLIIGEELERAKPDPLPYLTGLKRLGGRADCAFAFEDSLPGIRAATGAGIPTYGIRTGHGDAEMRAAGAVATIADFTDAGLWRRLDSILSAA